MGAVRKLPHAEGHWTVDSAADLSLVQKVHGSIAYITDEAVWAIYNANLNQWRTIQLGQVPIAGLDPND